jgi:hypothetical protein
MRMSRVASLLAAIVSALPLLASEPMAMQPLGMKTLDAASFLTQETACYKR